MLPVTAARCRRPTLKLWHRRLNHSNSKYLKIAVAHIPRGEEIGWCEACIKGGIEKCPFNKTEHHKHAPQKQPKKKLPKTTARMEKVMADACKPFVEKSAQGNVEMFVVHDGCTHPKTWVLFGKRKSDFNELFKALLRKLHNETGKFPVLFAPDGCGEFVNNNLEKHLKDCCGTDFKPTAPGNPNQNPYVERVTAGTYEWHHPTEGTNPARASQSPKEVLAGCCRIRG